MQSRISQYFESWTQAPLSKSHPLDTTTRFQTIRSATPGKEKKKKFNLPAVQIDEDEAERREKKRREEISFRANSSTPGPPDSS